MSPNQVIIVLVLIVAALLLGFMVRYLWAGFSGEDYLPRVWKDHLEAQQIPEAVRLLEKEFPDKVRFFNFWFQLHRLQVEEVPGDLAELGVYKGETARLIRQVCPSRKLHLFDTFTGFPAADLEMESGKAATYTPHHFADTSVEKVLLQIGKTEDVIIHKGYFPDTTAGLDHLRFAFVNMDADLYLPTRAGLAFFYPRLSPGGVMIIHDHNHLWPGIMRAVREFQTTIPESFILLPDMDSSVMLIRNR